MKNNTKYQQWMEQQDVEFIHFIHIDGIVPEKFKDDGRNAIMDLAKLEVLDNYYITPRVKND